MGGVPASSFARIGVARACFHLRLLLASSVEAPCGEDQDSGYHRRVTIISEARSDRARGLAPVAAVFHSLSDPTRLAIVKQLAVEEARVSDLVSELELAQSTVSAHMACLRDCGLVAGRAQGRSVHYSLSRPEVLELLAQVEALLTVTGKSDNVCCNYVRAAEQQSLPGGCDA